MSKFAISLLLIPLLAVSLGGCLSDGDPVDLIRVGDGFSYRLDGEVTVHTDFSSVESLSFEGRNPCVGLDLKRVWEVSSGKGEQGGNSFCTDPTLYQERVYDYRHMFTDEMVRSFWFGGALGVFDALAVCALACDEFSDDLTWSLDGPLNVSSTASFESLEEGVYIYKLRMTSSEADTELWNVTFDFTRGKWPDQVEQEMVFIYPNNPPGKQRSEQTLVWNLVDERRGTGTPVPFHHLEKGAFTDHEGVSWQRFPPTAGAPFSYTLEEAYADLQNNLEGLLWIEDHPEAFLASARYGVWDAEDGQRQYTWNLLFAEGEQRLGTRCHKMIQQTSLADVVTDQSCWDVQVVRGEELHRSEFPESTLDWGDLYERWSDIGGKQLPINDAYWTVFSDSPSISSPYSDRGPATDGFTAEFSFYPGSFDTEPESPNWMVLPPGARSYSLPAAQSIFDPSNGRPYVVQVPIDQQDLADDPIESCSTTILVPWSC